MQRWSGSNLTLSLQKHQIQYVDKADQPPPKIWKTMFHVTLNKNMIFTCNIYDIMS